MGQVPIGEAPGFFQGSPGLQAGPMDPKSSWVTWPDRFDKLPRDRFAGSRSDVIYLRLAPVAS